eukprot:CAMPEP_0184690598 /NCGR_PEP_ID=MMETSP0312-20130426/31319_1 /TAXON_ID=31354 /ORGANISM="Compsopogon coeruleus, Strain SAG 36.94" /LENGTH=401 /DNA_ID=CAMNT_0027148117 /DNA_START=530 /DNA_END=1735 /DNA_ORIENTATION=+
MRTRPPREEVSLSGEGEAHTASSEPQRVVLAFVNPASGGQRGEQVLDTLRNLVPSDWIFDLGQAGGPSTGIDHLRRSVQGQDPTSVAPLNVSVLICGGDGTFSWVASALSKSGLVGACDIRVIPVPLGSGNDMARALGWGIRYPGASGLELAVLAAMNPKESRLGELDVWKLTCHCASPLVDSEPSPSFRRAEYFCNYLSLGIDAKIELEFNEARWRNPERYSSQRGNIAAHTRLGASAMFLGPRVALYRLVDELIVDDKPVQIPAKVQSLIFLNIPSYAAGSQPWGKPEARTMSEFSNSLVNDGCLEVMALVGLHHFVATRVGIPAVRLAQGRKIRFRIKVDTDHDGKRRAIKSVPMQADGEPWPQGNAEFEISLAAVLGVVCGDRHSHKMKNHAKFHFP